MGGLGSGRTWFWGAKDTIDDYRSIDVRRWNRDGLLVPFKQFNWRWTSRGVVIVSILVRTEPGRIILNYRHRSGDKDWKDENYPVCLDWTACYLGGQRPWFLCPDYGYGRRVAILYCVGVFACRHSYQLAYPSQRETYDQRAERRAGKIREKLGWELAFHSSNGWKPKGMHWSTFKRLITQHDVLMQISLAGLAARFNLFE